MNNWIAREKQCRGECSEAFEREFREWLETQPVGIEFGHGEGSRLEQSKVENFLWRHGKCKGLLQD
jgi:hypothetical protein